MFELLLVSTAKKCIYALQKVACLAIHFVSLPLYLVDSWNRIIAKISIGCLWAGRRFQRCSVISTWRILQIWLLQPDLISITRNQGFMAHLIGSDRSHDKCWEAVCERVRIRPLTRPLTWPPTLWEAVHRSDWLRQICQRVRGQICQSEYEVWEAVLRNPKFLTFDSNSTIESDVLKIV